MCDKHKIPESEADGRSAATHPKRGIAHYARACVHLCLAIRTVLALLLDSLSLFPIALLLRPHPLQPATAPPCTLISDHDDGLAASQPASQPATLLFFASHRHCSSHSFLSSSPPTLFWIQRLDCLLFPPFPCFRSLPFVILPLGLTCLSDHCIPPFSLLLESRSNCADSHLSFVAAWSPPLRNRACPLAPQPPPPPPHLSQQTSLLTAPLPQCQRSEQCLALDQASF